jgi:hypothetical protein
MTPQLASLTSTKRFADAVPDGSDLRSGAPQGVFEASLEELAYRESNGIEITLLWDRTGGSLSVFVVDRRCDEMFELDVADNEAMEVFHHPYAYAAFRGVEPQTLGMSTGMVEPELA